MLMYTQGYITQYTATRVRQVRWWIDGTVEDRLKGLCRYDEGTRDRGSRENYHYTSGLAGVQ